MILANEIALLEHRMPLLLPVFKEARTLLQDVQKFHRRRWRGWSKSWFTDDRLFFEMFGEMPLRGSIGRHYRKAFWSRRRSWWESKGRLPESAEEYEISHSEDRWEQLMQMEDLFDDEVLRSKLTSARRFIASKPVPALHLAVDDLGNGSELVEHLSSHRGTRPSAKWFRKLDMLVADIGQDDVSHGLANWAETLMARDLAWVDWEDAEAYSWLQMVLSSEFDAAFDVRGDLPEFRSEIILSEPVRLRRYALHLLGEEPNLLCRERSVSGAGFDRWRLNLAGSIEHDLDLRLTSDETALSFGAIWAMSTLPGFVETLEELGAWMFYTIHGPRGGPRSKKCANACKNALEVIGTDQARRSSARIDMRRSHKRH